MAQTHSKEAVLAATRCLLSRLAGWTSLLYDTEAPQRLIEQPVTAFALDDASLDDFLQPGSAGPRIETSLVLLNMARVYEVGTTGRWQGTDTDLHQTHHDLQPFHELLRHSRALVNEFGDDYILAPDVVPIPLGVLNAFEARRALFANGPLELPALAALAGLAEKTVRMAAIGRDRNPDLVTYREGSRTYVTATEATRWLEKRRNPSFAPTVVLGDHTTVPLEPQSNEELPAYLRALREAKHLSLEGLAELLGWSPVVKAAYAQLEAGEPIADLQVLEIDTIARLGSALHNDGRVAFTRAVGRLLGTRRLEQEIERRFPYE